MSRNKHATKTKNHSLVCLVVAAVSRVALDEVVIVVVVIVVVVDDDKLMMTSSQL